MRLLINKNMPRSSQNPIADAKISAYRYGIRKLLLHNLILLNNAGRWSKSPKKIDVLLSH